MSCFDYTFKLFSFPIFQLWDTKGVIRIRNSTKDKQKNGKAKNYKRTNNDPQSIQQQLLIYKDRARQTPLKLAMNSCAPQGKEFLLHYWHLSCYSSYKRSDRSCMRKGPGSTCDKWNICSQWRLFQKLPIGPRVGVIYNRYAQHTEVFTENGSAAPPKAGPA
jgi:hypothetical protein